MARDESNPNNLLYVGAGLISALGALIACVILSLIVGSMIGLDPVSIGHAAGLTAPIPMFIAFKKGRRALTHMRGEDLVEGMNLIPVILNKLVETRVQRGGLVLLGIGIMLFLMGFITYAANSYYPFEGLLRGYEWAFRRGSSSLVISWVGIWLACVGMGITLLWPRLLRPIVSWVRKGK